MLQCQGGKMGIVNQVADGVTFSQDPAKNVPMVLGGAHNADTWLTQPAFNSVKRLL